MGTGKRRDGEEGGWRLLVFVERDRVSCRTDPVDALPTLRCMSF